MEIKRGFIEVFLVIGFTIFIAGLLTGMLAINLVSSKLDSISLFMMFTLGFLIGMLTISLVFVSLKMRELGKNT
jgi:sugar phosphate permease